MSEEAPKKSKFDFVYLLGHEIILGTMIALLSVFTGVASYQAPCPILIKTNIRMKACKP